MDVAHFAFPPRSELLQLADARLLKSRWGSIRKWPTILRSTSPRICSATRTPLNGRNWPIRVTTLYTDTSQFDLLNRRLHASAESFGSGTMEQEACVYLERKTRHQSRVRKKRTVIGAEQTIELTSESTVPNWSGRWFHQSIRRHHLRPVCAISLQAKRFYRHVRIRASARDI